MSKFLDKWNLWLFGVILLLISLAAVWVNGWTDGSRMSMLAATIYLAAAEVASRLSQEIDKKFTEK